MRITSSVNTDAIAAIDLLLTRIATTAQIIDAELADTESASRAAQRGDMHIAAAIDRSREGFLRVVRNALADFCISTQQAKLSRQLNI
jgi:hypothetical protein